MVQNGKRKEMHFQNFLVNLNRVPFSVQHSLKDIRIYKDIYQVLRANVYERLILMLILSVNNFYEKGVSTYRICKHIIFKEESVFLQKIIMNWSREQTTKKCEWFLSTKVCLCDRTEGTKVSRKQI